MAEITFHLTTLGTTDLKRSDGVSVQSVLYQPTRFALLVYLATAEAGRAVPRERLLGTFWPESSQGRARNSLNQAVHHLRKSLGADAIETLGNGEIRLSPKHVRCDATDLLQAAEAGDVERATALYAGEFLAGFQVAGADPALDHWLDAVRRKVASAACGAAWLRSERAEEAGDVPSAVFWARRACEWSGMDEVDTRRLMERLDRLGDRTGVLDAYTALEGTLRPLVLEPSAETRTLLARLKDGWRADDSAPDSPNAPAPADSPSRAVRPPVRAQPDSASSRAPRFPRVRSFAHSVAVTGVLTVAFLSLWGLSRAEPPSSYTRPTVTVEEPVMGGSFESPPPSRALVATVMHELGEATDLRVIAPSFPTASFSLATTLAPSSADSIAVTATLVETRTGEALSSVHLSLAAEALGDGTLARTLSHFVHREVREVERERRLSNSGGGAPAVAGVLAARRDRAFADSLRSRGAYSSARTALGKADSLLVQAQTASPHWSVPTIERAETSLATLWTHLRAGETQSALSAARDGIAHASAALDLDPANVEALELRARLAYWSWLLAQPDPDDLARPAFEMARRDARHATELDPSRTTAWNVLSVLLSHRAAVRDAYWAANRAYESASYLTNPHETHLRLFDAAVETGDDEAARRWCGELRRAAAASPPASFCALVLEALGPTPDTARASAVLARARTSPNWASSRTRTQALAAVTYGLAGDTTRARTLIAPAEQELLHDPELYLPLSWAHRAMGDRERAGELLEGFVALSPFANGWARESRLYALR